MALADPYASVVEYQAAVGTSDTGSNAAINSDLVAVSRWIDRRLGRHFNIEASVTSHVYIVPRMASRSTYRSDWAESENPYYYGPFSRLLEVDDIASTNGLEIKVDVSGDGSFANDTAWNTSDYVLRPLNATLGPEPRPYTRIEVPSWSNSGGFGSGARVQINAIHGWPSVPAAIKAATIEITQTLRTGLARAEVTAGGVKRLSVSGGLSVDYGGGTDAAVSAHRALIESLMREYGRARRFL